jgi:7-carboxy-7-deazaguanine synthase
MAEAQLSEIFSSFQGEGLYVGERQIFLRFAGCNLTCQYCDSPQALAPVPAYKLEASPGSRKFEQRPNPAAGEKIIELVTAFDRPAGLHHSLSLTGGEPLLQVDFMKEFIPELKKTSRLPVYLETNGTLPDHLDEIIEQIDIVAMDMKLPSATGFSPCWKEHRKFLETAYLKEVFVKVVVARGAGLKEIEEAAALIKEVDEKIPLVLQPVSPHGPVKHRPTAEELLAFHAVAKRKLKDVRVIPQMHRLAGML